MSAARTPQQREELAELQRIAAARVVARAGRGEPVDALTLAWSRRHVATGKASVVPYHTYPIHPAARPPARHWRAGVIHALPLQPRQRQGRNGPNLYQRLLANTEEPEHDSGCWPWTGKRDRGHYPQVNVWVPGLQRRVTLQAHIALWVWLHAEPESIDEFYLQYRTFTDSGLQLDHLCVTATCICPDHVDPCTPVENIRRRDDRRQQRSYFAEAA